MINVYMMVSFVIMFCCMMANETIWGKVMATTIKQEDILNAVQAMSIKERLKLIAEIASLPDTIDESATEQPCLSSRIPNQEVKELSAQFINNHKTLLRRLAQ
jgi:hypothetical protein